MTARETLDDHLFSGDALQDFGITEDDIEMSGLLEECLRSTTSAELEEDAGDEQSTNTGVSTVKMSNLKTDIALPVTSESNGSSTDHSSCLSSFEEEHDSSSCSRSTDALTLRYTAVAATMFIGLSFLGFFMFWVIFPYFQNAEVEMLEHPQGDFFGTVLNPPTVSPSHNNLGVTSPSDLFTETGQPPLDCPTPLPKAPPLPGKKGIYMEMNADQLIDLDMALELNPYWNHATGALRATNQPDFLEFLPTIQHGDDSPDISQTILELLQQAPDSFERILGFYEPDASGPNTMTVETAIDRWDLLEEMNVPLVSPSAIDSMGPWMRSFMQAVEKKCLRVDWIGVHWYGGKSFHTFKTKLEQIHNMYRRPILLTEFATVDWKAQDRGFNRFTEKDALDFMKQALPWLEEQDWIAGYSWYPFDASHSAGGPAALFDDQGELTAVGRFYASVRQDNPQGDQNISL
eukprot:scaffold2742_cov167-Amphora_coffeaeformis.AAC.3